MQRMTPQSSLHSNRTPRSANPSQPTRPHPEPVEPWRSSIDPSRFPFARIDHPPTQDGLWGAPGSPRFALAARCLSRTPAPTGGNVPVALVAVCAGQATDPVARQDRRDVPSTCSHAGSGTGPRFGSRDPTQPTFVASPRRSWQRPGPYPPDTLLTCISSRQGGFEPGSRARSTHPRPRSSVERATVS